MTDITITIQLFGAFRPYGESVDITVPAGADVAAVKTRLAEVLALENNALVYDSALANDNEVLGQDTVFQTDTRLAILPPVCGG